MPSPFYNVDGTVEFSNSIFNYLGGIARAVLGRGTSRFRHRATGMFPFNNRGTILLDTSPNNLMWIAQHHPHLNTVISRGAELFSMMEIKHCDKDGEPIENSPVLKFLRQPNPLQTQEDFAYEFYLLHSIYNKTFQHIIKGLSFERLPDAMWLLPTGRMKINVTGQMYRQTKIEEIITSFEMEGEQMPFETNQVIYLAEGVGETPLNPVSRIESLQIPLSNIFESLKSRNIIVGERGAIGIISRNPTKGDEGFVPSSDSEKKKIEEHYQNQYHLDANTGRGHVIITSEPYSWNPMTIPIGDLGLIEGNEEDFARIIDAFRHDRDLYSSVKGATFENKSQGTKSTIQLGIQPLADKLMRTWTKYFLDPNSGEYLEACYNHLPCMKEDELKKEQAAKTMVERLSTLYRDGRLTPEQYNLLAGVDNEVKDGITNGMQANLRGLVGSASALAAFNQLVATEFIDPAAAQAVFVNAFGYEPAAAAAMVTKLKAPEGATAPTVSISSAAE
jgi:hypothetical protein